MRGTIFCAVLSVAALSGCLVGVSGGHYATPTSSVYVSTPDLVAVSPGVQVVVDYDEPVFYTDGFYWRYYGNSWYRSNHYATGWYYYERPPIAVLQIERPYAYARYRPQGYAGRNRGRYQPPAAIVRDHRAGYGAEPVYRSAPPARQPGSVYSPRDNGAVVRDHRTQPPAPAAPVVREHRTNPPASAAPVARPAPRSAPVPARTQPNSGTVVRDHR
jgi:hypothetical protein